LFSAAAFAAGARLLTLYFRTAPAIDAPPDSTDPSEGLVTSELPL
jgi:hypothetical protein